MWIKVERQKGDEGVKNRNYEVCRKIWERINRRKQLEWCGVKTSFHIYIIGVFECVF